MGHSVFRWPAENCNGPQRSPAACRKLHGPQRFPTSHGVFRRLTEISNGPQRFSMARWRIPKGYCISDGSQEIPTGCRVFQCATAFSNGPPENCNALQRFPAARWRIPPEEAKDLGDGADLPSGCGTIPGAPHIRWAEVEATPVGPHSARPFRGRTGRGRTLPGSAAPPPSSAHCLRA